MITRITTSDAQFNAILENVITRGSMQAERHEDRVKEIIRNIREKGDRALFGYIKEFDGISLDEKSLKIERDKISSAQKRIPVDLKNALLMAAKRIHAFHERQKEESWRYIDEEGVLLGQLVTPLDSVGVYVPGGRAAYPSSVLMNAIPAKVAGVKRIAMCTPLYNDEENAAVLAAADIAGVDEIYRIGGAQAVGALAYGTESIEAVDKIVGPGNIYVALAKKLVFGDVDIDMIAGPSEILIIADETGNADFVAADMIAQAEHDELASAILITTSEKIAEAVIEQIHIQLQDRDRKSIIGKSLDKHGIVIVADTLDDAFRIARRIAPEHLELAIDNPENHLSKVSHAGAVFLGNHTPETFGDYIAGPNHVLPTGGTARFSSPLGTYDFQKRSSVIQCSEATMKTLGPAASLIALAEGLDAHAYAVNKRIGG